MTDIPSEADVVVYTEPVRVEGELGATEVVAQSDTGAKRTAVDDEIAGEGGAGPITGTETFRSSNDTSTRLLAEVTVVVRGRERTGEAKIADRSDISYQVRLGRDGLGDMLVDVERTADAATAGYRYRAIQTFSEVTAALRRGLHPTFIPLPVGFLTMSTKEVTIDLGQATLTDVEISRSRDGQQVDFTIKGSVYAVDEETVEEVMLSREVDPVSITLSIDDPDQNT